MIITKKHLSRRTFLQGTFGAAMALPLLDAMVPALTAQGKTAARTPFRFGAIRHLTQPLMLDPDPILRY